MLFVLCVILFGMVANKITEQLKLTNRLKVNLVLLADLRSGCRYMKKNCWAKNVVIGRTSLKEFYWVACGRIFKEVEKLKAQRSRLV